MLEKEVGKKELDHFFVFGTLSVTAVIFRGFSGVVTLC